MAKHRLTGTPPTVRNHFFHLRTVLPASLGVCAALGAATFLAASPAGAVSPGSGSLTTTVYDASTNVAWAGTETVGAVAYDTAVLSVSGTVTPTGTVTYSLFDNGSCSGTAGSTDAVTLSSTGSVPDSSATAALAAGTYGYSAAYSGDGTYAGLSASCESFSVGAAPSATSTVVYNASTKAPWNSSNQNGRDSQQSAYGSQRHGGYGGHRGGGGYQHGHGGSQGDSAYDTATVTGVSGLVATGTLTYDFFDNGSCQGTAASTDTVTLAGGTVPASASTGALSQGSYSFLATYNGDSNYLASTAACEPFSVQQGHGCPGMGLLQTAHSGFSGGHSGRDGFTSRLYGRYQR
jgi:hypothetical protein